MELDGPRRSSTTFWQREATGGFMGRRLEGSITRITNHQLLFERGGNFIVTPQGHYSSFN